MKTDPHREEAFVLDVRREYDRATIVGSAFEPRNVKPEDNGEFVRIGRRFYAGPELFMEELSRGGTSYSSTILGLGRSIAIGEEKYFISKINETVNTVTVRTKREMLESVESSQLGFSAVFMPIDYYADFHVSPQNLIDLNGTIQYREDGRFLNVGARKIPPYWSSTYVEFDKFFFVSPSAFEWLVRPDERTGHRVRIKVVPNEEKKKFDVTCETIASLKILDSSAILAFKLEQAPATGL